MSWRRFVTLFKNLSPFGAAASRIEELKKKPDEEISEEEGKAQAAAFFSSMLSTSGPKR